MKTYKLGNKATGIIRAYSSGNIGNIHMKYDNEPYTIIKSVDVNLTFEDLNSVSKTAFNQLAYNNNKLSQVQISNVVLNDKILNLIFPKSQIKLVSRAENYTSNDTNEIWLHAPTEQIVQVFIFNAKGQLENAYGEHDTNNPITVNRPNADYLICYQFESLTSYSLDKNENFYLTLDLIITGNVEDNTSTMNIHIEKCGLKVDRNMYFDQKTNTVDLIFTVIDTGKNYITIE